MYAIITEDLSDYYFSTIPINNAKLFFEHIVSFNNNFLNSSTPAVAGFSIK